MAGFDDYMGIEAPANTSSNAPQPGSGFVALDNTSMISGSDSIHHQSLPNPHLSPVVNDQVSAPAQEAAPAMTIDSQADGTTCNICGKHFRRAADLRRHSGVHDANKRTFVCPVLRCTFRPVYRKDKLVAHARKMHADLQLNL